MGWRGTLLLALALAVATLFAWLETATESPERSWRAMFDFRPTPPADAIERLFAFDPDEVTALVIARGEERLRTVRGNGGWRGASRPDAIEDLIQAMRDLALITTLDVEPRSLDEYGLGPPRAVIELERSAKPPLALRVGDRNPPSTAVYVQVGEGAPVVLTGALLLWELDKAIEAISGP